MHQISATSKSLLLLGTNTKLFNMSKGFRDLGLRSELTEICEILGWKGPTAIQEQSIPVSLSGKNVVALAETGSGKTGAYVLPILQKLTEASVTFFAVILTPTRELAMQVQNQFVAFGKTLGLHCSLLVGGIPIIEQAKQMRLKPPHVIIATPGRFIDHIKKTKNFDEIKLRSVKFLVVDEADRMMGSDFVNILERVVTLLPRDRQTLLFSATMTDKVNKLTKAAVRDPVRISTRKSKFQSVAGLRQFVHLVPQGNIDGFLICFLRFALGDLSAVKEGAFAETFKDCKGLQELRLEASTITELDELKSDEAALLGSAIVFTRTRECSNRLALLLRQYITSPVIALNGDMPQAQRIGALSKFKKTPGSVLVATDIASRGLDIPEVGLVINYDVPLDAKTYMHRVGRTARAGRKGCALTLLTQYSVVFYLDEIEAHLVAEDGKAALKVPALIESDSQEDQLLDTMVEELTKTVHQASNRAQKTVDSLKRGKRVTGGAFTSVQDVRDPELGELDDQPGLKRSLWAAEAPESQKKEISRVMATISTEGPVQNPAKKAKKRFKNMQAKRPRR